MFNLSLADLVYNNYCEMWRSVGQASTSPSIFVVEQSPEMLVIRSNFTRRVPHMILDPTVTPGHEHAWIRAFLRDLGQGTTSLMVGIPPGLEEGSLISALRMAGFALAGRPQFAMTRPISSELADGWDAHVDLVRDEAGLEEAHSLLSKVFDLPNAVFAYYTPPQLVDTLLLRIRGRSVGVACLCPFAGVAGIYSLAVLPTERGNGYARRLLKTLLANAAMKGLSLAVLSSERDLAPFYQRQGFSFCWEQRSYWLEAWWR